MNFVPNQRTARLALLPDSAPSVSFESLALSEASGDGDDDPPGRQISRRSRTSSEASPSGLRLASNNAEGSAANQGAIKDRFPENSQDLSEELGQGLGWIGGVAIALLTLVVPLTSVVRDREDHPTGLLLPKVSDSGQQHGSDNPSGLSSAWIGESSRGDSGRKP
jgi:hypothetical protein